jgi:hypothetical protein
VKYVETLTSCCSQVVKKAVVFRFKLHGIPFITLNLFFRDIRWLLLSKKISLDNTILKTADGNEQRMVSNNVDLRTIYGIVFDCLAVGK